jgi:purine-nucleoside phosphorylase
VLCLGSGLGHFTGEELQVEKEMQLTTDIPHFPVSTVEGHKGKLVFGKLGNKNVVVMAGRFHLL